MTILRPPATVNVSVRLTPEQDARYRQAAERAGLPAATWLKTWGEVGAIWPEALQPFLEALRALREEYLGVTRPIDVSPGGWEVFVEMHLPRLAHALTEDED